MRSSIILEHRYSGKKDNRFSIKLAIRHKSKSVYITLPYRIPIEDWHKGKIRKSCVYYLSDYANIEIARFQNDFSEFSVKLAMSHNLNDLSANDIKNLFLSKQLKTSNSIASLFNIYINKKRENNPQANTPQIYEYTLKLIERFRANATINNVNIVFLENFESFLRQNNNKANSIGLHMRNLRTIYNFAISRGLVQASDYPFKAYHIPTQTTRHRTISPEDLKTLFNYTGSDAQNKALNLFKLSFYLIGMNFKDMLMAKNSDIVSGRLFYVRAKTDKQLSIKIQPEAKAIIDIYRGNKYMLYFLERKLKSSKINRTTAIHSDLISYCNKYVKQICNSINLGITISTYYARHTWATTARKSGVDYDIIRAALGHSAQGVTGIYIEYDDDMIDEANRKVIDYIK